MISKELIETCELTETSVEGMTVLVDYYINSLGWTEEEANKYALGLFKEGVIEQIKILKGKN